MNKRKDDPKNSDFLKSRRVTETCMDHEYRISNVEQKVQKIDDRQERIFTSMYGTNGDPKEGYVWKMEKVLEWAMGVRSKWSIIEKVAMSGAISAIGVLIWHIIRLLIETGKF